MACGAFFTVLGLSFLPKTSLEISPTRVIEGPKVKILGLIWILSGVVNIALQASGLWQTSLWIVGCLAFGAPILGNSLLSQDKDDSAKTN